VHVGVYDVGVATTHADLAANYDPSLHQLQPANLARVLGDIENLTLANVGTALAATGNALANILTGNNFANTLTGAGRGQTRCAAGRRGGR
jgi:hypothetical protein